MRKITRKTGAILASTARVVLFLLFSASSFAQISFNSTAELEQAANDLFEKQEFVKAKPLFSQLLSKEALNPNYNYRFGVCILFTEADALKPLPYIEGGANSTGVNPEAHYFLGRNYQLNYRFDEAITAYQKARTTGFSASSVDIDRQIEECRNGKMLFNADVEFEPAQEKDVIESEFYRPYDFRKLKGKVIPMPPNFKTKYDLKNLTGTFIYTPSQSSVLFFASYGEEGTTAKDLYRVKKLPNGEWAIPMRLSDVINTKYDEDFGFFDESEQTLYFASNGHNTMGGYDVFSSKYNSSDNTWSTPLNLQFPINSPYDDFLYVNDRDRRIAYFTSARKSPIGKLKVFKTLLFDPLQVEVSVVDGIFSDETDSIYNYMTATVIDPKTKEIVGKYRSHKVTGKYLLILPPKNDYTMNVAPKESGGFEFDLDVPKREAFDALKQKVVYNDSDAEGTVTVTNYFNGAGKKDTVVTTTNRELQEVLAKMVAMPEYVPPEPSAAELALQKEKAVNDSFAIAQAVAQKKRLEQEAIAEAERLATVEEKAKAESLVLAQQIAEKELAKKDSVNQAKLLVLKEEKHRMEKADKEKEEQLSQLAKANEEKEQHQIQLVAEIADAKEQALKDSVLASELSLSEEKFEEQTQEANEFDDVLKELEQPESELLNERNATTELLKEDVQTKGDVPREEVAKAVAVEEQPISDEESQLDREVAAKKVLETEEGDAVTEQADVEGDTEPKTETDLFLQTIARLEQQKLQQDSLIAAENAAKEAEAAELAAKAEKMATELDRQSANEESGQTIAETSESEAVIPQTADEAEELAESEKVVILKSDANPNEYLAALNEIEEQIAEDAASRPEKSYELIDIEPSVTTSKEKDERSDVDPSLEARIEEDKRVIAEHQLVAEEKERKLKIKLKEDREVLKLYDSGLANELKTAEQEVLDEVDAIASGEKSSKVDVIEISQPDLNEQDASVQLAAVEDVAETKQEEVSEVVEENHVTAADVEISKAEDEVSEELAAVEEILESKEADKPAEQNALGENKEESLAEATESSEPAVVSGNRGADVAEDEWKFLEEQVKLDMESESSVEASVNSEQIESQKENLKMNTEVAVDGEKAIEETVIASQNRGADITEDEWESLEVQVKADMENKRSDDRHIVEGTLGSKVNSDDKFIMPKTSLHLMTPALRNYAKREANFEEIENKASRRMIQRMRAEDIGRLGVLKNIRNQRVDAKGEESAIRSIEENKRNQDVLANAPKVLSRAEVVRRAFDKNDLRKRVDVYYKVGFEISTSEVSETVLYAMDPELVVTFTMPEFALQTEYYQTYADARSGYYEYRNKGFDRVSIIAYHKRAQVAIQDIREIPFVE